MNLSGKTPWRSFINDVGSGDLPKLMEVKAFMAKTVYYPTCSATPSSSNFRCAGCGRTTPNYADAWHRQSSYCRFSIGWLVGQGFLFQDDIGILSHGKIKGEPPPVGVLCGLVGFLSIPKIISQNNKNLYKNI